MLIWVRLGVVRYLLITVIFIVGCAQSTKPKLRVVDGGPVFDPNLVEVVGPVPLSWLIGSQPSRRATTYYNDSSPTRSSGDLRFDAYGPDIHMNQYGQPVTLWPDFGATRGEDGLQPLFDARGKTAYFLEKNGRMINPYGESVAWMDKNGNVYNYEGQHQGWFKGGHIRGHDGGVMLYQPGAYDLGVIRPIPEIPPIPPIPHIEPIRPIPSIPPIEPIPSFGWSEDGLE